MKMKRLGYFIVILMLSAALSVCFLLPTWAEDDTADGTDAASAVWEITHSDGSVSYAYSFNEAFAKISDGDYYKLLPATYEVYLADYAKLRPSSAVNITIDLRGTTIIAPETGDVNGQIFDMSDKFGSTYTVLMENAKIYAAPGGRCAFSAANTSVIDIDGGENGGLIYAGGALNLTSDYSDPDTYSVMKNIYSFKSTGNMAGMICSRNTSKLKLVDCYAVSNNKNGVPLYVRNSGQMILENSHGISLDGGTVLQFVEVTEATRFTLGKGCTLYGNTKDLTDSSLMKILSDTSLEKEYNGEVSENAYITKVAKTVTHGIYTSSAVGEESYEEISFAYSYEVVSDTSLDDTESSASVWRLEGDGGVKYAKTLSALNVNTGSFNKATLLCDLSLSEAEVISIVSDLELDFNGKKVTIDSDADIGFAFNVSGEGNLTVSIGSSEVNLIGCGFIRATNNGIVSLTSSGNIAADTLVSHPVSGKELLVTGGLYLTRLGSGFSSYSDMTLDGISAISLKAGNLVSSRGNITVNESALVGYSNSYALNTPKTLTLSPNNYFVGKVTADTIIAGEFNYFEKLPEYSEISIILISADSQEEISVLSVNENGGLTTKKNSYNFAFYTEEYVLTDNKGSDSVWKLEDSRGNVKYTNHIYTPFLNLSEFVNYTLLNDVTFDKTVKLVLSGDIKIDLGGMSVSLAESFDKDSYLFEALGDGVLTVSFTGSVIDSTDVVFIYAEELKGVKLLGDGGFISAKTVARVKGAPITAEGGYYSVTSGAIYAEGGAIDVGNLTAYAPFGEPLLETDSDVTINSEVLLISPIGAEIVRAGERLMVADGVNIYGKVSAKDFYSAGTVGFAFKPDVEYSNMLLVQERANNVLSLKTLKDGKVSSTTSRLTLSYKTVNITSGLKASLTLSSFASLNVYIPASVVNSDPDFTLRIVLSGLLYEAGAKDGRTLVVDGKSYVRFSYPYVYPTCYDESVNITLISGSFSGKESFKMSEYLENAISVTEDEKLKTVIASYARFTAECSGLRLAEDSPLLPYVKDLTVYEEKEAELLFDYFRAVRYEPSSNELRFTPWTSCDYTLDISYAYGDKTLSYTFDSRDGTFAIPVFRFDMTSDFKMTFTNDDGVEILNINLYELADFAEDGSDTRMLLTLYLAYANAIFEYNELCK